MSDKAVQQVPPACAALFHKGLSALERNEPAAAIPDFLLALDQEPGFFECREALRHAAKKLTPSQPGFLRRFVNDIRFTPLLTKARLVGLFKPLKAMAMAERVLTRDPSSYAAHKVLADAALAADLPRTAVLSLEEISSGNRATSLELAEAFAESGNPSEAAAIYGRLLKVDPSDTTVLRALKSHAGQVFAPPMPMPEEVKPNDLLAAVPDAPEPDDALIRRYEKLVEHCPRNIHVLQTLADAYVRCNQFDKALVYYQRALKVAGGKSPALKKAIAETSLRQIDHQLNHLDASRPDYSTRREELQNKRLEFQWNEMNCVN